MKRGILATRASHLSNLPLRQLFRHLCVVMLLCYPLSLCSQAVTHGNSLRAYDELTVQELDRADLSAGGYGVVWSLCGIESVNDGYPIRLEPVADAPEGAVSQVELGTRCALQLISDTLYIAGMENRDTRITYDDREACMYYPMHYGDSIEGYFQGHGVYCDELKLHVYGRYKTKADGCGWLVLPDGDTLRNVIRLHTERAFGVRRYAMYQDAPHYDNFGYPREVQFTGGHLIRYVYSPTGHKLRTTYVTAVDNLVVPLGTTLALTNAQIVDSYSRDYCGSTLYERGGSQNTFSPVATPPSPRPPPRPCTTTPATTRAASAPW